MSEETFHSSRTVVFTDSSLLSKAEYDPKSKTMHLHFLSTGSVWEYKNIAPSTFGLLISAHSVGKHFNKYVRPYLIGEKISSGLGHRKVSVPATMQAQLPL